MDPYRRRPPDRDSGSSPGSAILMGMIFAALGAGPLLVGVPHLVDAQFLRWTGVVTSGIVQRIAPNDSRLTIDVNGIPINGGRGCVQDADIQFLTASGENRVMRAGACSPSMVVGQRVPVVHDPNDPARAMTVSDQGSMYGAAAATLGGIFAVIGAVQLVRGFRAWDAHGNPRTRP